MSRKKIALLILVAVAFALMLALPQGERHPVARNPIGPERLEQGPDGELVVLPLKVNHKGYVIVPVHWEGQHNQSDPRPLRIDDGMKADQWERQQQMHRVIERGLNPTFELLD